MIGWTHCRDNCKYHDDAINWKHFPRYWPFVPGSSPVTVEFPAQRPVTRSFEVLFDVRLNTQLSKQSWGWWFETSSCPLWSHCNVHIEHSWWNRKKKLSTHLPHLLDRHLFCYYRWADILANLWLTTNTSEDDHWFVLVNVPSNCDNLPNSFILITVWVSRDVL